MRLNYIDNMDCLEGMKAIPDGSVDLIVTDPPYGIMAGGGKTKVQKYGVMEWDKAIAPEKIMPEFARILRPRGRLIMFSMEPLSATYIVNKYPLLRYAYKLYWRKNCPALILGSKKNPVGYVEEILLFNRADLPPQPDADKQHPLREYFMGEKEKSGLQPADFRELLGNGMASHYFTQGEQFICPTESAYKKLQGSGYFQKPFEEIKALDIEYKASREEKRKQELNEYAEKYPAVFNLPEGAKSKPNILEYAKDQTGLHPTQKPIALIEDLVKTYSNPGDVVLDAFMGSGTTAVACIRTGRSYIGFEMNPEYYAVATRRAKETEADVAGTTEDAEGWLE